LSRTILASASATANVGVATERLEKAGFLHICDPIP
jgi:hypothetical protein